MRRRRARGGTEDSRIARPIIEEPPEPGFPAGFARAIATASLLLGCVAALHYHAHGLTLSHYDAKAHLVVARRVVDTITPSWAQIGAVWLPLPHLLNLVPVQLDAFYRTGASAIAISVLSFALAVGSIAWMTGAVTGSRAAGVAAGVVFALNPNVLYLQSTPMTEPLLLGLLLFGVSLLYRWTIRGGRETPHRVGLVLAAACWTRYEAWPVVWTAWACAAWTLVRNGRRDLTTLGRLATVAAYPAVAILLFFGLSRATVGEWFVTGGFFVPDNPVMGKPIEVLVQIGWGVAEMTGRLVLWLAAIGTVVMATLALTRQPWTSAWIPIALVTAGALPFYAFFEGHPFRIRYMVPLIAAAAMATGFLVGLLPRYLRSVGAGAVVAMSIIQVPPFDPTAPMVTEAQWDVPKSRERAQVTACLLRHEPRFASTEEASPPARPKILMSMGSLAHYMQELSHARFAIKDFVHEGTGSIWMDAIVVPRRHVEWIVIEERAEGGDVLAGRARSDPAFLAGFVRTCEGGGLGVYRRK